jgi:GTP-binding protein YchF
MALQCGIVGLVNSGKTTIFNCISNTRGETNTFGAAKPNLGMIQVPDSRLYELEKKEPTEKIIHTTFEVVDIPGLTRGSGKGEGNRFLAEIRNTDALVHVLRCFEDENVPHADGSVNPVRDIETVDLELQLKDLESVEKKIARLERAAKTGDKDAKKGLEVLALFKDHFENFGNARDLLIKEEDRKHIEDLFLLTMKPVLFVCNVDQESAVNGNRHSDSVREFLSGRDAGMLIIAGTLEAEIADLTDISDRMEFLNDAGLEEPGVNRLVQSAYSLLKLKTFFTVGPKEIRGWTIRDGMTAPQAAGVIHSDLERGFIRAEVMKYNDYITYGSEHACREAGRFFVEGKNYVVDDGDILHIRFNI